ncbi:MAG: cytochrome c3 family protein [Chthoniobacteraceae bacterium]
MTLRKTFLLAAIALALPIIAFFAFSSHYHHHREQPAREIAAIAFWQHLISPGELSVGHATLENNCASCHTANKGVEAQKCIVCHADDKSLLARQPSAFHAEISSCAACHIEHQGRVPSTTRMDHASLAHIGLKQAQNSSAAHDQNLAALAAWLKKSEASPHAPQLQRAEAQLDCAACHSTKDRHRGLFGTDCASCHATAKWTIAEFRHPSSGSQSCAQCHQAPPSHYMMHFQMISMKTAGVKKAEVSQCFLCHQTTSWNDIKGVGLYKHH